MSTFLLDSMQFIKVAIKGENMEEYKHVADSNFKVSAKLGCVVRMVVDSILPHTECGPNDHRKDAPRFITDQILFMGSSCKFYVYAYND